MTRHYRLAGIAGISGLLLILYQAVCSLEPTSTRDFTWKRFSIFDIAGERYLDWVGDIPLFPVQEAARQAFSIPISSLLLGASIVLCIYGFFGKTRMY